MVFGGLGIMLYGGERPLWAFDKVLDKVDVQSMFFAAMFMIIILVLGTSHHSFPAYGLLIAATMLLLKFNTRSLFVSICCSPPTVPNTILTHHSLSDKPV